MGISEENVWWDAKSSFYNGRIEASQKKDWEAFTNELVGRLRRIYQWIRAKIEEDLVIFSEKASPQCEGKSEDIQEHFLARVEIWWDILIRTSQVVAPFRPWNTLELANGFFI